MIYLLLVCCFAVVDVATRHVPDSFMELEDILFIYFYFYAFVHNISRKLQRVLAVL
jgi:hypothetical protein